MRAAPAILLCTTLIAGCAIDPRAEPTLYTRLGGAPVVARISDETIERSATDARTKRSFEGVKVPRVKEKLAEQICELSGGPCRYTGDPMKPVHQGLKITGSEFDLLVEFLRDATDRAGVGTSEKNELLRLLAPMRRDIVSP